MEATKEKIQEVDKLLPENVEESDEEEAPLLVQEQDEEKNPKWQVGVRVKMYSIGHINTGMDSNFYMSFSLKLTWYNLDYKDNVEMIKLDPVNQTQIEIPEVQIANIESLIIDRQELTIRKGGLIHFTSKYVTTLKERYDLRLFPFDTQALHLRLRATKASQLVQFRESYNPNSNKQYIFVPEISGFHFESKETRIVIRNEYYKAEWILQCIYKRSRKYYLSHIYLPLFILQLFNFFIIAIDPLTSFAESINLIMIQLLITTALRYGLVDVLPQVSYITMADVYINANYIIAIMLGVMELIYYERYVDIDKRGNIIFSNFIIWVVFTIWYFSYGFTRHISEADQDKKIIAQGNKERSFVVHACKNL